ncbi:MAG TPA: hypothetical protein VLG47_03810 [Candidatus Saccharimonadales bacterium]|nr:hypothetical protein [Candidatus Saccharimonadales bacterium]
MLTGENLERFEALHTAGMAAKNAANAAATDELAMQSNAVARESFQAANLLALQHQDWQRQIDALQPWARASWALGDYDDAELQLTSAYELAKLRNLNDEMGMVESNRHRLAAIRIIREVQPVRRQISQLRADAVPRITVASLRLMGSPHYYYRFANAEHGSVTAALANERIISWHLIIEGLSVAFRKSPEPYDQVATRKLSSRGLKGLAAAALLIPLGGYTPFLAKRARRAIAKG